MAHPKRKISKTRRDKRRTHYKAQLPQLATCPTTGTVHVYHRAYYVDGDLYYKGKLVLVNVSENMQQSLDLAGIKHFIDMFDDLTEAVGSF